jgi:N-acylneuraminate cytidylyltransferase
MKNIALLCGRGGSVSIRDKNLYPVLGRPLMLYPLLAAKTSKRIDEVFLSTDSERMKEIAREHGVGIIDRPPELATPTAQHVDTLIHALAHFEMKGVPVRFLAVVMCNCATYPAHLIDACVERLENDPKADSCVTGYVENDHHPYRVKRMRTDGYLGTWMELDSIPVSTNRQDLPPCYILDHAIWVLRVATCFPPSGQKPWTFMGKNIVFMENPGSCDIHSVEDILYTEKYLRDHGWTQVG